MGRNDIERDIIDQWIQGTLSNANFIKSVQEKWKTE